MKTVAPPIAFSPFKWQTDHEYRNRSSPAKVKCKTGDTGKEEMHIHLDLEFSKVSGESGWWLGNFTSAEKTGCHQYSCSHNEFFYLFSLYFIEGFSFLSLEAPSRYDFLFVDSTMNLTFWLIIPSVGVCVFKVTWENQRWSPNMKTFAFPVKRERANKFINNGRDS